MKTQISRATRFIQTAFMRRTGLALVTGALLLTGALPASADELKTPIMQQGSERGDIKMPAHGQSRDQVQAAYGQPTSIKGPIGQPPITQWVYGDFIVYFEYDHVIHSVRKPEGQ